jgi:hypothetical protein
MMLHFTLDNAPADVLALDPDLQTLWLARANDVYAITQDETKAALAAWGAVDKSHIRAVRDLHRSKSAADANSANTCTVAGWGTLFTSADDPDLHGQYFDDLTDMLLEYYASAPLFYEHGHDPVYGSSVIGQRSAWTVYPEIGVWVEHELDPNHPQFARTRREIEAGVLAYSGDAAAAPSAADFDPVSGHIGTWVAAAWSLVKQPAEPALGPVSAKSYVTALKSAFVQQQTAQAEAKAGSPAHEAHEPAQSNAQQATAGQQSSVGPVEFEKSSSEGNPMNLLELLAGFFNVEATADAIVPALTAFVAWLGNEPGDEPVEDVDFSTVDLAAMKAAFELDDEAANADLIPHFEAFKAALVEPPAAAPDYSALAGAARGLVTQQAATPADEAPPAMTPAKSVAGGNSPTIYTSRVQVLGERPSETPLADMILAHRDGNTLAAAKAVGGQVGPQGGYLLNEVTADHLLVEPFYANEVLVQLGVQTERFPGAESFEAPTWRSGARAYWAGQGKKVDESGPSLASWWATPRNLCPACSSPTRSCAMPRPSSSRPFARTSTRPSGWKCSARHCMARGPCPTKPAIPALNRWGCSIRPA